MFKKATKKQCKLRLAIMGVSGSGKTYSALRVAQGLGGKIAVVDTERKSASKYSDRFDFDVAELQKANISSVIQVINEAGKAGYDVLIIDSLTHAWQELLEEIDKLAATKYKGNSFRAWSEGTPKQKQLISTILNSPCHIIATMRAKTEYIVDKNDKGKTTVTRAGVGAEQGKGIEYEFDMLMEISQEHIAQVWKDRTGKFQDQLIEKPDEELGQQLAEWLEDGEPEYISQAQLTRFHTLVNKYELDPNEVKQRLIKDKYIVDSSKQIQVQHYDRACELLQEMVQL